MSKLVEHLVKSVWMPPAPSFRRSVREATESAFVGRSMIRTLAGETVLLEDVLRYNQKAEGPLVATFRALSSIGRSDVARLIEELYPGLVPYFIGCGSANPVHHTSYVLQFLAVILAGEKKHQKRNVRVAMLAALFHDVALGRSKLPKITEAHIKEKIWDLVRGRATLEELKKLSDDAEKARREHMEEGALIAERELTDFWKLHDGKFDARELDEISRLIKQHDYPKIPPVI